MADQNILNWIRDVQGKGYSQEQIRKVLIENGYTPEQVSDAMNSSGDSSTKKAIPANQPVLLGKRVKWEIIIPVGALLIFIIILLGSMLWLRMPTCGNGVVEKGETSDKCCKDAGCSGQQVCNENKCSEPICGECQFLDEDLHECRKYSCCTSADCNDNAVNTVDSCIFPKSLKSECRHNSKISLSPNLSSNVIILDDKNSASLELDGKSYGMYFKEIKNGTAEISNSREEIILLGINQPKDIDIQPDGKDDITLTLLSAENSIAKISISKVTYVCFKDADCDDKFSLTVDKCINAGTKNSLCRNDRTSCNKCEYLEDGKCLKYACCNNEDCKDDKADTLGICLNPKTKQALCKNDKFTCGGCQYNDNGVCKRYLCCVNLDCDDGNSTSNDTCLSPKSLQAACKHT